MTSDHSDFGSFLDARWPSLVRTLVFLGHPQPEAEQIALDALSRMLPEWRRMQREEDVDVGLYQELVDARERHLRAAGDLPADEDAAATPGPADDGVPPGLVEQAERREQVEAALATMPEADREVVVLRYVAELSDDQVADVLESAPGGSPQLAPEDVRLAAEAVVVEPLTVRDVADRVRARRRRTWTRAGAAVAVLVLLVGAGWWFTRPDQEPQGRGLLGRVAEQTNLLSIPWYFDGQLHLAEVTVEVRPVRQLVQVPHGVVYSDDRGAVVLVGPGGHEERIGETLVGSPLVAEPDTGWVAWADAGDGNPLLLVYDTRLGQEVGRRSLATPGHGGGQPIGTNAPVAVDGQLVYYSTDEADYAWDPVAGVAFSLAGSLVDVANGARVTRLDDGSTLARPGSLESGNVVTGRQLQLTPDGRYLFAVIDGETVVYDVETGELLPRMYSPSDRALSWGYDAGSFYFTVQHKLLDKHYQEILQMPSKGNYRIYECRPDRSDACQEVTEVSEDVPDAPVLAH